jgi:hypothetical protein
MNEAPLALQADFPHRQKHLLIVGDRLLQKAKLTIQRR